MSKSHYTDASAGTGKTYSLTHKIADLIKAGELAPEKAIVTTFTKMAAAELRSKTRAVMYEYGRTTPSMFEAADRFDRSLVGTIDSLALDFVQRYWQNLGITPESKVLSDDFLKTYISAFLSDHAGLTSSDIDMFNLLKRYITSVVPRPTGKKISSEEMSDKQSYWRDWIVAIVENAIQNNIGPIELRQDANICLAEIKRIFDPKIVVSQMLLDQAAADYCNQVNVFYSNPKSKKSGKTYDERIARCKDLKGSTNTPEWYEAYMGASKDETIAKKVACSFYPSEKISTVVDCVNKCCERVFEIAIETLTKLEDKKREDHYLTYVDMEKRFLELLENNKEAADSIKSSYTHLLVDEFQDSSTLQVKIFLKLAEILGEDNCYFYGDVKQVLYSWRNADVDLTKEVSRMMVPETPLNTSYRSCPQIVSFTNHFFSSVFPGMTQVNAHKTAKGSLEVWDCKPTTSGVKVSSSQKLSFHIANLISTGVKPSDIAVLARNNFDLDDVAQCLQDLGINVNREMADCSQTQEAQYIIALLGLIRNPYDGLSKAILMQLHASGYNVNKIVEECIAYTDKKTWQGGISTYFEALSKSLYGHSVAEIVKTLISTEDVFGMSRKWENYGVRKANVQHILDAASEYEKICQENGSASTIDGFKEHLMSGKVSTAGDVNGVSLLTFHKSKGLEWPVVIIFEKDEKKEEEKFLIKEVCGVHTMYDARPSASNLFPRKRVIFFPNVIGSISDSAVNEIITNGLTSNWYAERKQTVEAENNRLLYVAYTRAKQKLVLMGLEAGIPSTKPFVDSCDIHTATGVIFSRMEKVDKNGSLVDENVLEDDKFTFCPEIPGSVVASFTASASTGVELRDYVIPSGSTEKVAPGSPKRNCSPSTIKTDAPGLYSTASVSNAPVFAGTPQDRISSKSSVEDNVWGDCIHHIFALAELWSSKPGSEADYFISEVADQYGITFDNPTKVREAWNKLTTFLNDPKFGVKQSEMHELEFRYNDKDGRVFSGSMDFVWKTDKGCVIVDYKTFQGGVSGVVAHIRKEEYQRQLACYREVAEKSGIGPVLATYVYCPVTQSLVETFA